MLRRQLLISSSDDDDENERDGGNRRLPIFRDRVNYNLVGHDFKERFRLTRGQFDDLLNRIGRYLEPISFTNHPHTAEMKLLSTLHWLGNGGQYHGVGDMHGCCKATIHKFVHRVVAVINEHLFNRVIAFPRENPLNMAQRFYQYGNLPNVSGVVDGILLNIIAPVENEGSYVDRHGNHSINVMAVCGPNMEFMFVSARWPGAVNDARIMRNSRLFNRFEEGWRPFPGAIILGDSGYPLNDWLIPPLTHNLQNDAELQFNRAHRKLRRLIECSFGILKKKFPCLNYLRLNPIFAAEVIKCCCVLHNLALADEQLPDPEYEFEDEEQLENNIENEGLNNNRRNELIRHFQ